MSAPGVSSPGVGAWLGGLSDWRRRALFVGCAVLILTLPNWWIDTSADVRTWAQYLCYATLAVGIDLAWGYGGMLVLGHGLFFGLGAYCMAFYLTLENRPEGSELPSFMALYSDFQTLPMMWKPFQQLWFTLAAAVLIPVVLATALGFLVFTRRVRGPYFALLTQATALVFTLVLIGNLPLTAGFNGLTDFTVVFGRNKFDPDTALWLYRIAAVVLLVVLGAMLIVVRTRFGRLLTAVRDGESRVRYLGYNPALVKTVGFAISAGIAGVAGAVAAPIIGIINPGQFGIVPSILFVCWVAVGGRGTLWGAVVGALVVNWVSDSWAGDRPDDWEMRRGLFFVVILAFAPGGILGIGKLAWSKLSELVTRPAAEPALVEPDGESAVATAGGAA